MKTKKRNKPLHIDMKPEELLTALLHPKKKKTLKKDKYKPSQKVKLSGLSYRADNPEK